jgi:glycosyltransferase involved in cell wall biosynthesis
VKLICQNEIPFCEDLPHLSVVIPVYKADRTLKELYLRLKATVELIAPNFEIIFVEDSGEDHSWQVIEGLAAIDPRVRGIQLSRNFGQHAATLCGFAHARGRWVATLDDDLEHAPENLPMLLAKAEEGYDLVYGVFSERSHMVWRNLTSNVARWLFNKAITSLNHEYTSYRFIRGDIARSLTQFDSPYPFIDGYLSWVTNRYATVEVQHNIRANGSSNYTSHKLFTHALNIFVTFSDLPLRLASWFGLLFFFIGMGWLGVILIGRMFDWINLSGYASILGAIVLFGGIQLLILGVFGEYIGRINFKSSRKPLYIVGKSTMSQNDE